MLPPEKSSAVVCLINCFLQARLTETASNSTAGTGFLDDKKPESRFNHFNSATQTSVNSRPLYQDRAGCQRLCLSFFRCCLSATAANLASWERLSKSFFQIPGPSVSETHKERGREINVSENLRKSFFHFFFTPLYPLQPGRISPQKGNAKHPPGSQQSAQCQEVGTGR